MARTASPSWNGQPVAAAAPTIDKTPVPVIHSPKAAAPVAEPVTACGGSCSNTEAPCGPCSRTSLENEETDENEERDVEEVTLLARLEGELARATAPAIETLADPTPTRAALSGMSWQDRKDLIREAAREVFGPIFENFEEVERVTGVFVPDFDESEAIVNVDVEDDAGGWRETFWQVGYTIEGNSITFGDTADEQVPTREYQPTGESVDVA